MDSRRRPDNQRVPVCGNRSGFRKVAAPQSLYFFPMAQWTNPFTRKAFVLCDGPVPRRFFVSGCMGRRPASIEPKNILGPGREVDPPAGAVFRHRGKIRSARPGGSGGLIWKIYSVLMGTCNARACARMVPIPWNHGQLSLFLVCYLNFFFRGAHPLPAGGVGHLALNSYLNLGWPPAREIESFVSP